MTATVLVTTWMSGGMVRDRRRQSAPAGKRGRQEGDQKARQRRRASYRAAPSPAGQAASGSSSSPEQPGATSSLLWLVASSSGGDDDRGGWSNEPWFLRLVVIFERSKDKMSDAERRRWTRGGLSSHLGLLDGGSGKVGARRARDVCAGGRAGGRPGQAGAGRGGLARRRRRGAAEGYRLLLGLEWAGYFPNRDPSFQTLPC